jgi:hypothetical protein
MTFDLIVRDAAFPDARRGVDIGAREGKVVATAPGIAALLHCCAWSEYAA